MSSELTPYQPKPRNAMMIKNLCPGLVELGKIKIGNKGAIRKSKAGSDWQPPVKLDHFLITTNERGADDNLVIDEAMHSLYGAAPKEIPVRLVYDDIALNLMTRYICYYGKSVFCSGDGVEAARLQRDGSSKQIACPCGRQDPKYAGDNSPNGPDCVGGDNSKGKCKINGVLSAVIDGAQTVGGVWKFRTTSYNSVVGMLSSLAMIQAITGGRLAGIPLKMTVSPKTTQDPVKGGQVTIQVVGLFYAGTMDTLRETGYQIALNEAKYGISMKRIEEDAMLMLSHNPIGGGAGFAGDSDQDVIEEFYPEEAKPGAPALVGATEVAAKPVTTAGSPAATGGTAAAPPLAGVSIEAEVIDFEGEQVDTATGEVVEEPAAVVVPEKAKVKQPTKKELAAAAVLAGQQAAAAQGPADQEQPPHPCDDDSEWADPPTPSGKAAPEAQPEPVAAATPAATPAPADESDGDLF